MQLRPRCQQTMQRAARSLARGASPQRMAAIGVLGPGRCVGDQDALPVAMVFAEDVVWKLADAPNRRPRRDHAHGGKRILRRRRLGEVAPGRVHRDRRQAAGEHRWRLHGQRRARRRVRAAPSLRDLPAASGRSRGEAGSQTPQYRIHTRIRRAGPERSDRFDAQESTRAAATSRSILALIPR